MTSSIYFEENQIILWSANFIPSFKSKPFANHEIGSPGFREPSKSPA